MCSFFDKFKKDEQPKSSNFVQNAFADREREVSKTQYVDEDFSKSLVKNAASQTLQNQNTIQNDKKKMDDLLAKKKKSYDAAEQNAAAQALISARASKNRNEDVYAKFEGERKDNRLSASEEKQLLGNVDALTAGIKNKGVYTPTVTSGADNRLSAAEEQEVLASVANLTGKIKNQEVYTKTKYEKNNMTVSAEENKEILARMKGLTAQMNNQTVYVPPKEKKTVNRKPPEEKPAPRAHNMLDQINKVKGENK